MDYPKDDEGVYVPDNHATPNPDSPDRKPAEPEPLEAESGDEGERKESD